MKRFLILILAFLGMMVPFACQPKEDADNKIPENQFLRGIRVSVDTLFLHEGEVATITGTTIPEDLDPPHVVHWNSSNESVFKIDENGRVTAVSYGYAFIIASVIYKNPLHAVEEELSWAIPVYVSFNDNVIPNPEEMYQKWLGRWSMTGTNYKYSRYSLQQYAADYTVSIQELNPLESYRFRVWGLQQTNMTPYPWEPLELTVRFDRKTGRLVFFKNQAQNDPNGIYLNPFLSQEMNTIYGDYGDSNYPEDNEIGYARLVNDDEATSQGAFARMNGKMMYHLGMGFSDLKGIVLWSDPTFFPIKLYRQKTLSVYKAMVSETSLELEVEDEYNLSVTWYPMEVEDCKIEWASSNPDVVSVDNGHLTALSAGQSDIIVSVDGICDTCEVVVKKRHLRFCSEGVHDEFCRRWDTDGDGEVSYEEAATVISLGLISSQWYQDYGNGLTMAPYLNEIQYFTSVTEIEPHCFYNLSLREITFPESIKRIGEYALTGNDTYLQHLCFLGPPPEINDCSLGYNWYPDKFHIWVPDEYYDAYMEKAQVEGSHWALYRNNIIRVSERKDKPKLY